MKVLTWIPLLCAAFVPQTVDAQPFDDNLGYQWKSISPNGYELSPDGAKNAPQKGFKEGTTHSGIATKLLAPNFNQLAAVDFRVMEAAMPDPASPARYEHFNLRMSITNKSGKDWKGFIMELIDNNNTPKYMPSMQGPGSILHPDRAHFHSLYIDLNALQFMEVNFDPAYNNTDESFAERMGTLNGSYKMEFSKGMIKNNTTWDSQQYWIHAKDPLVNGNRVPADFTLRLTPVPVPEPATLVIVVIGLIGFMVVNRKH